MPADVDFWELVNKAGLQHPDVPKLGRCWEWTGPVNTKGEPVYLLGKLKRIPHRYAWRLTNGVLPSTSLGSLCFNDRCVRPSHRVTGVPWLARLPRCRRAAHPLWKGHPNTSIRPDGKRQCRKCTARRVREMYARRRQETRAFAG